MFTREILMEALPAHYDRLRAFELDRARKMLAAGQPAHVAMEALSRRLTSKLLHDPLSALNAAGGERARLAVALMRIYRPEAGCSQASRRCFNPFAASISSHRIWLRQIAHFATSTTVEPARFDITRWAAGGIILSSVATRYQLGLVFHAGSVIVPPTLPLPRHLGRP